MKRLNKTWKLWVVVILFIITWLAILNIVPMWICDITLPGLIIIWVSLVNKSKSKTGTKWWNTSKKL